MSIYDTSKQQQCQSPHHLFIYCQQPHAKDLPLDPFLPESNNGGSNSNPILHNDQSNDPVGGFAFNSSREGDKPTVGKHKKGNKKGLGPAKEKINQRGGVSAEQLWSPNDRFPTTGLSEGDRDQCGM